MSGNATDAARSTVEPAIDVAELHQLCTRVRVAILDQIEVAGSGHYGSSLSLVELLVALYHGFLRVRPAEPHWPDRDRFILSKGHGCSALYAVLADLGFFPESELATFTRLGSRLGDHPDRRKVPGVDFSSGSLGHGLAIGCGMAEAQQLATSNGRTVVLVGDGEHNEGQMWEAAAYAAARELSNILVIVDVNGVQVDGSTAGTLPFGDLAQKWRAFGWDCESVNGHDLPAIKTCLDDYELRRHAANQPSVLIATTKAGNPVSFMADRAEWHLGYLHGDDRATALAEIHAMYSNEDDPS